MDPSDKNYLETKNPGFSITEGESHRVCWCCPERNANIIVEQLFDDSLSSPVVEQESFLKDHKSVETKDRCSRKLNFNGLHISKIALKEKVSTKSIAWHMINPVSNRFLHETHVTKILKDIIFFSEEEIMTVLQ